MAAVLLSKLVTRDDMAERRAEVLEGLSEGLDDAGMAPNRCDSVTNTGLHQITGVMCRAAPDPQRAVQDVSPDWRAGDAGGALQDGAPRAHAATDAAALAPRRRAPRHGRRRRQHARAQALRQARAARRTHDPRPHRHQCVRRADARRALPRRHAARRRSGRRGPRAHARRRRHRAGRGGHAAARPARRRHCRALVRCQGPRPPRRAPARGVRRRHCGRADGAVLAR